MLSHFNIYHFQLTNELTCSYQLSKGPVNKVQVHVLSKSVYRHFSVCKSHVKNIFSLHLDFLTFSNLIEIS